MIGFTLKDEEKAGLLDISTHQESSNNRKLILIFFEGVYVVRNIPLVGLLKLPCARRMVELIVLIGATRKG